MNNIEKRYPVLAICISRKNSNGLGLQGSTAHGQTNGKLITVAFRARKATAWDSNITLLMVKRMENWSPLNSAQEETTVWDPNITLLMVKWIGIQSWVAFLASSIMVLGPPRRRRIEFHKFLKVWVTLEEGASVHSLNGVLICFGMSACSFVKIWVRSRDASPLLL